MKSLPDGRDKATEEEAFLVECHRTKNRRQHAKKILASENFFDASLRPPVDKWSAFYEDSWVGEKGEIKGSEIVSALRDHLAGLQKTQCCYCATPLLKGGYSRQIEHVLPKADYPRFSLYFWNLAIACERCNRIKRQKNFSQISTDIDDYPEPSEFTEQFHPRLHQYDMHIKFARVAENSYRYSCYVGLTGQGRNLVDSVLIQAAQEEALESNDPAIAEAMSHINSHLQSDNKNAQDKIEEFQAHFKRVILTQAAGI